MTSWGWPVSIKYLKSLAVGLLQAKGDYEPLGQHWYKNFLTRHPDLKTVYSRSLNQSRKDAIDYPTLALADKHTLQFMNEGLVRKSKAGRQDKTKKHFSVARILTMEETLRKEERKAKEQQEMDEKERRAALRGLVGFAKGVWKEFQMGIYVFE
jgi:hypothetical protein